MSEALAIDAQSLRRTQSAGDIHQPPRARLSTSHHRSEQDGRNFHASSSPIAEGNTEDTPRSPWFSPNRTSTGQQQSRRSSTSTSRPRLSLTARFKAFFGIGPDASRTRKALVSVVWTLAYGFFQVAAIIAVLGVASVTTSPTNAGVQQIDACGRPLVAWDCIWIVKVCLSSTLAYWNFVRIRKAENTSRPGDAESGDRPRTDNEGNPRRSDPSRRRQRDPHRRARNTTSGGAPSQDEPTPPYSYLYARLSLLSSMLTLTWFLTAHILEYTSVDSCRLSSPLVWWLTFGILCTMYFLVLEVLVFGFLVFMVLPFIMLFYSIILLCLGRHPLQNPHYIKPEIEKLPKAIVERIPLVIYIPPPPEDDGKAQPISLPKPVHSYPPKPPASRTPRRRFAFFRRRPANKSDQGVETRDGKPGAKSDAKDAETWEDTWEQCEYPFVRLEGNRAACAICLMDFEEPKRLSTAAETSTTEKREEEQAAVAPAEVNPSRQREEEVEIPVERITEEERGGLPHLEDAGVGPQPLRLLACGHVFHKTCIDPWLTDVSGRCPVCQRPVELDETEPKKSRRRRRS
ncbi:hypothetical protein DEU56DRAFT_780188 [Suillus clintonianus]|uniref:uncharacterized protein n=1 Tax=Suillus clintonianus TaxID=1904413 RepID=UPI001B8742E5|nr:uncharacterized protein DEU56DRAFT_780188 [Suillus clintonianus]KAG2150474.1 hypothetical protein DEU56DRAFT_780188 [Suillus clintonianus]